MKLSEKILSKVNSLIIAETEAAEYRMECDRVEQAKAEEEAREIKRDLIKFLQDVDKLIFEAHFTEKEKASAQG